MHIKYIAIRSIVNQFGTAIRKRANILEVSDICSRLRPHIPVTVPGYTATYSIMNLHEHKLRAQGSINI